MIQPHEPAILDLGIISLHDAIRRVAARILETPGELEATHFRRVGHLMRIAVALAGAGRGLPLVAFHDIRLVAGPGVLPAALEGDPEALHAFEQEAELLLETEDIQLV